MNNAVTEKQRNQLRQLRLSKLFDAHWYRNQYRDVDLAGMDPAEHYLRIGAAMLRDPGPDFSTRYYLQSYPDVDVADMNPLLHFESHGKREGRSTRAVALTSVDEAEFLEQGRLPGATTALKSLQSHHGLLGPREDRPTLMICAHTSGEHLFGSERSLLDVVEALGELDFNLVLTIPRGSNASYLEVLQRRCMRVYEFSYDWWRAGNAVDERAIATFAHLLHRHEVSAVHVNTIMLREPLIAARRMGVSGVVHVRELIEHDHALCRVIGLHPKAIIDHVLNSADHIIANSRATASSFWKSSASHYVPNTVDFADLDIPHEIDPARINIALVSSNVSKKGLYEFVELARLLLDDAPQARLRLIGPENDHVVLLRAEQVAGRVPSNIEFFGYSETSTAAMAAANIVVNISHFQESFGRTVLEAMGARRPVVAYDWGAVSEHVRDGETGYLVPFGDVVALAGRLVELCGNPSRLLAMGEAGRQHALALYSRERYVERLQNAYREILSTGVQHVAPRVVMAARGLDDPVAASEVNRIAYFLWHFPVPSETFVLNELRILVQQGHDVEVFCRQSPYPDFIPDFPIRWHKVDTPAQLADQLEKTGRTIVHAHFTYPTVTEMLWPACEIARVPFTFIAHAQDIFRYANDERNRVGEIAGSRYCLKVLVPSRFHREYLAARGVPDAKMLINPNGLDPTLYPGVAGVSHAGRVRSSICAVHRFTEKKGLSELIRAAPALAREGIALHLYGYGELEQDYRTLIETLGVGNVHVHGAVEGRKGLLDVFYQHDLFVCPSIRATDGDMDGIPTVLMEAMASGLPVLTTSVSGIPDLVQEGVTGFLCQPDADSIAAAVIGFYSQSDAKVQAVINQACQLVTSDFDVAKLTGSLMRLWSRETIDILLVSWNNLPELKEVVRRIFAYTDSSFHLVICDNGSAPDVTAFLCELYAGRGNVTIILNRDNALVGPGTNICMEHSESTYAVYVCGKEGFILGHGWERRIMDYMDTHPNVGLAGTLCHAPSYLLGRQYPEAIALFPAFRNPDFAALNPEREFAHVQGGFFAIRRSMFESIGGFSDDVPHNYTDVEYSYYAESMGWALGCAPGMLALYNKTRPGIFTRMDESISAIHPPTLRDLALLDMIKAKVIRYCGICDWRGREFRMVNGEPACPGCGSRPADRSLHRFLAESTLTYRRLPAFGVGVGEALGAFWRAQFQGGEVSIEEFETVLGEARSSGFASKGMHLVYLDANGMQGRVLESALAEAGRMLADAGLLVIRAESARGSAFDGVMAAAAALGFASTGTSLYASEVNAYDWRPLLQFRRVST